MRNIILNFPQQFKIGFQAGKITKPKKKKFDGVCICGMGGSALPGNLLTLWLNDKKNPLPIITQRDYHPPWQVKNNWFIICISYSGNTEETISCFQEARKRHFSMAVISSNGKLEKLAKQYNIPYATIPTGLPPRLALGYQFSALVSILKQAGIIQFNEKEVLDLKNLKPEKLETQGKSLAKKLQNKIPVIYASNQTKYLARIWKIAFNENAKTPAFWNYFSELNHNEMIGFEKSEKRKAKSEKLFYFIILQDQADHPRIKKRINLTAKILKQQGLKGEIINLQGKTFLKKIFNSILLAYWASFYLAKIYKVDPIPVKLVEDFKKQLANS